MSDVTPTTTEDSAEAGRDALRRHAWPAAFDLLSQADRDGSLSAVDLEGLALAAFFSAKPESEILINERAFKAHEADLRRSMRHV